MKVNIVLFSLTVLFLSKTTYAEQEQKVIDHKLPQVCEVMLEEINGLLSEAEEQPGTHPKLHELKESLTETKEDLRKLDNQIQTKSCEKSLNELNKLKNDQSP